MGALPIIAASELRIGSVGHGTCVLRAGDRDLCIVHGDPEATGHRLIEVGAAIANVADEVRPPAAPPLVPSLVAVADLVRGDRVALDRTGEAPVSMSRSWATVTDVAKMAGRLPLIMVLTDAETRSRRSLRPEVQVWAMRPAAATGTDAEAAA